MSINRSKYLCTVASALVASTLIFSGCSAKPSSPAAGSDTEPATSQAAATSTTPGEQYALTSISVTYGDNTASADYQLVYNANGYLEKITGTATDGISPRSYAFTYNSEDTLASYLKEQSGSDAETVTLSYDASGNVVKEAHASYDDAAVAYEYADGKLVSSFSNEDGQDVANQYEYNAGGQLVKLVSSNSGSTSTTGYTYGSDGKLATQAVDMSYDGDSSHFYTANYEYDADGHVVAITYNQDGATAEMYAVVCEYDANGYIAKAIATSKNYGVYTTEFTCDEAGNIVVAKTTVEQDGSTSLVSTYEFTYEKVDALKGPELTVATNYSPQLEMDVISPVSINLTIPGVSDSTPYTVNSQLLL